MSSCVVLSCVLYSYVLPWTVNESVSFMFWRWCNKLKWVALEWTASLPCTSSMRCKVFFSHLKESHLFSRSFPWISVVSVNGFVSLLDIIITTVTYFLHNPQLFNYLITDMCVWLLVQAVRSLCTVCFSSHCASRPQHWPSCLTGPYWSGASEPVKSCSHWHSDWQRGSVVISYNIGLYLADFPWSMPHL